MKKIVFALFLGMLSLSAVPAYAQTEYDISSEFSEQDESVLTIDENVEYNDEVVEIDEEAVVVSETDAAVIDKNNSIAQAEEMYGVLSSGEDIIASGTCGDNVQWELDSYGTVYIFGEGEMYDYKLANPSPFTSNRSKVKKVVIGEGITAIGEYSFYACGYLVEIEFPETLTTIRSCAFSNCNQIQKIHIDSIRSWINLSMSYYSYNSYHTDYVDSPLNDPADDVALYINNEKVEDVVIPDDITELGYETFSHLKLNSLYIPSSLKKCGYNCFGKAEIKNLYIEDIVAWCNIDFGKYGVNNSPGGENIYIDGIKTTKLVVPEEVTVIKPYSFYQMKSIDTIEFTNVKTIEDYGLYWCKAKHIILNEGLESIGYLAFRYCDVDTLILPESLLELDEYALDWPKNLYFKGMKPVMNDDSLSFYDGGDYDQNVFYRCDDNSWATIRWAKPWHSFGDYEFNSSATCTKNETKIAYCERCGSEDIVSIEGTKLGHKGGAATCSSQAICDNCGKGYGKKLDHTYVKKTTKATLSKAGKIQYICSGCGDIDVSKTTTIAYPKTIKISATSYIYDGMVKSPTLTVKDSAGKTISSTYYTVEKSSGRKLVGKYTYKITFKTKYSGTKTLTFLINPKSTTLTSLTAGIGKMTVKWNKRSIQTTGYQIQYSTSSTFAKGNTTLTVTSNATTTKTIRNLTKGKKYYVRVRTYKTKDSVKYYSRWSSLKYVTIK